MIDPRRLGRACELMGTTNASAVIDEALARLIDDEETRRHVASYLAEPDADNASLGHRVAVSVDPWDGMSYETWRRQKA